MNQSNGMKGESIALEQPVRAEGSVEQWLMRLLQEAQRSLHSIIRLASQAIQSSEFNLLEFLASFPSQVEESSRIPHNYKEVRSPIHFFFN